MPSGRMPLTEAGVPIEVTRLLRKSMHSAMFVIAIPDAERSWEVFLAKIKTTMADAKDSQQISDNVWMVNVLKDFAVYARIIAVADYQGLVYKILVLNEEPQWLQEQPSRGPSAI